MALASVLVVYTTDEQAPLACAALEAIHSLLQLLSQSQIPYTPTIANRTDCPTRVRVVSTTSTSHRHHTQPDTIQDPEHSHRRPQAQWMQPNGGWHDPSAQQWRRARLLPLRYVIVTPEIGPNSCKIHPASSTRRRHSKVSVSVAITPRRLYWLRITPGRL